MPRLGQSFEMARKVPASEKKPPPKVTPVPIPLPYGRLPPKSLPAPSPPASSSQPVRTRQSMPGPLGGRPTPDTPGISNADGVSTGATTQAKPVFRMKRTGHRRDPFQPRRSLTAAPSTEPELQDEVSADEPPLVVSDILPGPVSAPRPNMAQIQAGFSGHKGAARAFEPSSAKKPDDERRIALSRALKERWSSGSMDHVPSKRRETIRKRKEAQGVRTGLPPVSSTPVESGRSSRSSSGRPGLKQGIPGTGLVNSHTVITLDSSDDDTNMSGSAWAEPGPAANSDRDLDYSKDLLDEIHPPVGLKPISKKAKNPLWTYLQPFLTPGRGSTLPANGHPKELLGLPRIRDLEWNNKRSSDREFNSHEERAVSALIVQVTGEQAPYPCNHCKRGDGLFQECVVMSRKAPEHPLREITCCANCFYNLDDVNCSHKSWGAERWRVISAARQGRADLHSFAETMKGPAQSLTTSSEDSQEETGRNGIDTESHSPSPAPAGIEMAEPGRPYIMWPDENGNLSSTSGAILPKKYQLDYSMPGRNWICPVRSCRQVFQSKASLGFHFTRAHIGCLFNDNGDGTLSITGSYKSRTASIGRGGKILAHAPPLVTSSGRMNPNEELPQPALPRYLALTNGSSHTPVRGRLELRGTRYPTRSTSSRANQQPPSGTTTRTLSENDSQEETQEAFWQYMRPLLHSTAYIPDGGFFKELLQLPRLRDLILNPDHLPGFRERCVSDIAAMAIQLSGDERQPCERCLGGHGPFVGCYVIARNSDERARDVYRSCANCLYDGNENKCSFQYAGLKLDQRKMPRQRGEVAPPEDDRVSGSTTVIKNTSGDIEMSDNFMLDESEAPPSKRPRTSRSTSSLPPPAPTAGSTTGARLSPGLVTQGHFESSDLLDLEPWEIAPGRLRDGTEEDADNIAFSKAFLSTNQTIPVCEDVAFRVDTIAPGATLRIESEPFKTRICSLAAGKLTVSIQGKQEQEFAIGPHGMFRMKAGASCVLTNRFYMDSILHTTLLSGYI